MSAKSTPEYLISNAQQYPNENAISWKDDSGNWIHMNWAEFCDTAMSVAKSLLAMGFESGDKLSIYSYNRMEWYAAYAAANMCNGAAVGVYHTCSPEEVEWVVGNSDSKFVFVGGNPMDGGDPGKMCHKRLESTMGTLDKVEVVISMDGVDVINHSSAMSWSDFISKGTNTSDSDVMARLSSIKPDDVAALIYTSGTTGNPKGVVLPHDNFD